MKSKQRKQSDLEALTENFKNSNAAMVLSFTKLTVDKDQQFRNEIREAGAKYGVVKNTLARLAVKGTPFEEATDHFNGVTSIAWTDGEPVGLSKVISKYIKAEKGVFEFKTGIVDGKVIAYDDVETIASLPSKDELIGKLLFLVNAPAQRLATALSAIPRDLAAVVKQVSERQVDKPESGTSPAETGEPEAKKAKEPKETEKAEAAKEVKEPEEAEKAEAPEEVKDEEPEKADDSGAPEKDGDTKAEPKEGSGSKEGKEGKTSEKEDKPKDEDTSTAKEVSEKESDSDGEGGGEPAGDESK